MNNKTIRRKLNRLSKKILGGRPWYQCIDINDSISTEEFTIGNKARLRTESFSRIIPKYIHKADRVLDIGCNAGLFTLEAAQLCQSAIGYEMDKSFYKQACFIKEIYKLNNKSIENIKFINKNILNDLFVLKDITVIFASKVLYHKNIGHGVYDLMKAISNSHVRLILAQGHTTQGDMGQNEGMQTLFTNYGFKFKIVEEIPEYPIVVGERI